MTRIAALRLAPQDLASGRPYLERDDCPPGALDRLAAGLWHGAVAPLLDRSGLRQRAVRGFVARVAALGEPLREQDDAALLQAFRAAAPALCRSGFTRQAVAPVFAIVREAATRALGKRHYDEQLIAGWLLISGRLAEMATGEGKTFAATLAACTAALAGLPVHVITVNDYLATRDAEAMAPLYRFLGLDCSAVVHGMERPARQRAYASDICYASNKELAFDYLRDRSALGDHASPLHLAIDGLRGHDGGAPAIVLRGLCYAIVDEADSVFIDEARTPLILSRSVDQPGLEAEVRLALELARTLTAGEHFVVDHKHRRVRLTDAGRACLADALPGGGGEETPGARRSEEQAQRALAALHLYDRDEHYVVIDGKVQIVDASTGRVMPDRSWEQGLHQMIECKEGVALTGRRDTLARMTYQRLFRRYLRLSGMTGTGTEVAAEIGRVYGIAVVRVPLHQRSRRRVLPARCLPGADAKWRAVADAVRRVAVEGGQPVLIGTRTVAASEAVSQALQQQGIGHVVLNAKQDRDEAEVVARAGERSRVTVATNMAGRGTDILLGEGVAGCGGLHVVLTEYNESSRIDRQLVGRSARQGDPGSAEAIVALDDGLFASYAPALAAWLARTCADGGTAPRLGIALLRWWSQGRAEALNREAREHTVRQDRRFASLLAFSGRGE